MKRKTVESNDIYEVVRFRQRTKQAREAAWLESRGKGVGGSDMATIMGLNKYATPYELWLEKTGRSEREDISGKWAIVKGNALEAELRRRFRSLHPELAVTDGTNISFASRPHPCMRASLDGILYDPETDSFGVLEIKTANASRGRNDWHDADGNLVIPPYYLVQVTHYMAVTGWTWGYMYADIGESEPVEIRFERDADDIKAVIDAAELFWQFVTDDTMPHLVGATDVARAYPQPDGDIVDGNADSGLCDLMERYDLAVKQSREAARQADELKDIIITRIGEHTGIRCGSLQATYKPYSRKGYVREVKPSTGRTFRFTTIKEENQWDR